MTRQTLHRVATVAAQSTEWLVLIFLLVAVIPPILVQHRSLTVVPTLNLIDGSWLLDTSYKAAGGIWFGRDVAFTYGPLFQWMSSAPSRWIGISTGAIYATWETLPLIVIILCTFLGARLLLPEAAAWRRALLVLLAVVFWAPPNLRVSVCLLAFLLFVRLTDQVAAVASAVVLPAMAAAGICVVGFLISADTGLYSVAALLLCVAATAVAKGRTSRLAKFLLIAGVCFAALVLVTNAAMVSPLDFRFWRSSMAIAGAYRWFEPTAMTKEYKRVILESLVLGIAVFAVAWWRRRPRGRWTLRPAFLLAGLCLAVLMLQTSLVRPDSGHIWIGIYPTIFLSGAIVVDEGDSRRWLSMAMPAIVVIATLLLAHAYPAYLVRNVWAQFRQMRHPVVTCPQGSQEFDRACFPVSDAALLSTVSIYTGLNTGPGDSIALFPYQTAFGLTSRHQVAGGLLQSYLANGEYLTQLELAGLQKASPPFGLYFPDGVISVGVDFIPNFTRSPDLWFYLLRHYHAEGSPMPGVVGLVRDDSRDPQLTFAEEKIAATVGPLWISKRSTAVDIAQVHWPGEGADFLKLRLRVNYPPWWRLRKPSKLTLQMSFADGTVKSVEFVLQPNHASDVWIYPWDDKDMGKYFFSDESQWRSQGRSALNRLTLFITPFDEVSVVPRSVSVESVEAVRIGLIPVRSAVNFCFGRNFYTQECCLLPQCVANGISADANHNTQLKPTRTPRNPLNRMHKAESFAMPA